MRQINIKKNVGGIEGLCTIVPTTHKDNRGYFVETYSKFEMFEAGINIEFIQDNQSFSTKGVLRGLHFQKNHPQTKLVRAIVGKVYSVAVDLRKDSTTYEKWYGVLLTEENQKQFLIPKGFAHGFLVLSDKAIICYKCDELYYPEDESGIVWNDPKINISWLDVKKDKTSHNYTLSDGTPLILSQKDSSF